MEFRQRVIVGALWLAVAGVMALTLEPALPTTGSEIARLFVVLLAMFLAALYLFDPWNLLSRYHFH